MQIKGVHACISVEANKIEKKQCPRRGSGSQNRANRCAKSRHGRPTDRPRPDRSSTDAWHGTVVDCNARAQSEPAASDHGAGGWARPAVAGSDGRGGRAPHGTVPHAFHGSGSCLRPRRAPHLVLSTPNCTRTHLVLPSLAAPPPTPSCLLPPPALSCAVLSSSASPFRRRLLLPPPSISTHPPPARPGSAARDRRWSAAASISSRRRRRRRIRAAAVPRRRRHPRWGAARSRSSGSRTPPTGR